MFLCMITTTWGFLHATFLKDRECLRTRLHAVEHVTCMLLNVCTMYMHALWDQIMQISKYASKPHYGNQDYDCACYTIYCLLSWPNFLSTIFFVPCIYVKYYNMEPMMRFFTCRYGRKCHALTMGWAKIFFWQAFSAVWYLATYSIDYRVI